MITVDVTEADIREGEAASCEACPVAIALSRATGGEGRVFSPDFDLAIGVDHLCMPAPQAVRRFVVAFDHFMGDEEDDLPALPPEIAPFSFTIPDLNDPSWEEQCYGCSRLRDPAHLDAEGLCKACHED